MDLLPRSHKEFGSVEYWDKFFKKRGSKAFEWYGEYPELCDVLHKYIKPSDKILMVGCGNSQLSGDMYDVGHRDITNIDISDIVIKQMTDKNREKRPDMKWVKMDMSQMSFADGQFSAVLDKGTLDAVMTDDSEEVSSKVDQMFKEIGRVLRQGGRYVCVSLLQDHILRKVLKYFPEIGWPVRIHQISEQTNPAEEKEFHMPVFLLVFTKFRKIPSSRQILEVSNDDDKIQRFDDVEKLSAWVKESQYYAVIKHQLSQKSISDEQITLELFGLNSDSPRYTLYVVDSPTKCSNKFAIFIVPEGRETEWLFSSTTGRSQLCRSAGFERLVIVTLHRMQKYESLEKIKAELSTKVMELSPPSLPRGIQVPFLSMGEDIGLRTIQHQGQSPHSGEFVVEDVEGDAGSLFRRLIFLSNQNAIQSEVRLLKDTVKKKGGKKTNLVSIDSSYLACQNHTAMVAGLALVEEIQNFLEVGFSALVLGLGGGGLPKFIHDHFTKVSLTAVEIDPVMLTVATDWFGFQESDRLKVAIGDAEDVIKQMADGGEQHLVVMLDIDSKDKTMGMSSPPLVFVQPEFLKTIKQLLHPEGVFVLNLACRDESLKTQVISDIQAVFPKLYCVSVSGEVNDILYCLPCERPDLPDLADETLPTELSNDLRTLNKLINKAAINDELPDLLEAMEGLKAL
ncbi:LOW QUALITY PROTEIN: eEF1A lysine and N-terminal methyltransferase-like [Liolophura sinensis]|uniref:LOW QUALITY PROTEIN: eEF1A lysine and N-terminal methyltransferase-like n=1 Tax=Liolophura sinensis TaxID=3198878 RepID=UPI003158B2C2